ncbi:MAG: T9SS type A sorting domain-containing protein, partial [Ignavibacteriaceae bacterium]|nr:T9SS type A sorting domain-containing protein [Ignavibacteriaceae bacterium]
DDSFEWFGGNVNCKYLIAHRGWDDDFDTDFGYSGKLQFLLGVRDPEIADVSGSHGFESDNDGSGSSNQPLTSPEWWNVTLIGPLATNQTVINSNFRRAMHLRRNSQNKINNTLMVGWPVGVLFDGTGTINGVVNGTCYIKNSILAGYRDKSLDTTRSNGTFDPITWFQSGANNNGRIFTTSADAQLNDAFNLNSPNALPGVNSPALTGGATPPNDGFFDATATYVGAFGSVNWTAGWSNFSPVTSIGDDNSAEVITSYALGQNYPNPFNPSTNIRFTLPESANVKLSVFNTLGEKVAELVNSTMDAGVHEVNFNAAGLSSGLYIYRLEAGNVVLSRKMNLLK